MDRHRPDTRHALIAAATDLISQSPGQDVSLRAICDRAGVKLPTLYHFFGNRAGMLQAVVEAGFDDYTSRKDSHEPTGDPIQDLRDGWDAHVAFGLERPALYALMYGQAIPGERTPGQERPTAMLVALLRRADEDGRLVVPPEQAVGHILAANIGVTLWQITNAPDPALSTAVREATIRAVTGTAAADDGDDELSVSAARTLGLLTSAAAPSALGEPETRLLKKWLAELARPLHATDEPDAG